MLIQKLENMEDFTNNEKEIAAYVLDNIEKILSMSADDLAERTFTSKAAVMRLCRKVNVKGYKEFQRVVNKEYSELDKVSGLINEEPIGSNTTYSEIKNILPDFYEKSIIGAKTYLDDSVMKKIIERLKKAPKIELYGVGITQIAAKMAAFKFMTLGIEAEAYDGINEHYIASGRKGKNNVSIVLSMTGNNPYVIRAAKLLKKKGVYVVGITGHINDEFKEVCSEYVSFYAKKHILSLEILSSVTIMNYILDIFFTSLLVENYYDNVKASVEIQKL